MNRFAKVLFAVGLLLTIGGIGYGTIAFRSAIPVGTASSYSAAVTDPGVTQAYWQSSLNNGAFYRASNNIDYQTNTVTYSVLAQGADPTGVLDSTTAAQAAITAASASGGTVYFPRGTYKITGNLTITSPNVNLIGDGAATLQDGYVLVGSGAGVVVDYNFRIEGLNFTRTALTGGNHGIRLQRAAKGVITQCRFTNQDHAINVEAVDVFQSAQKLMIDKITTYNSNYDFYVDGSRAFANAYIAGDIHITDSQFYFTQVGHVHATGIDGFIVTGNTMFFPGYASANPTKTQNIMIDTCAQVIIANNDLFEAGYEAVYISHLQNVTVSGNNIVWPGQRDVQHGNGIRFGSGDPAAANFTMATISGNTIMFPSASGISIEDNDSFVGISDNIIRSPGDATHYYGTNPIGGVSHYGITTGASTSQLLVGVNQVTGTFSASPITNNILGTGNASGMNDDQSNNFNFASASTPAVAIYGRTFSAGDSTSPAAVDTNGSGLGVYPQQGGVASAVGGGTGGPLALVGQLGGAGTASKPAGAGSQISGVTGGGGANLGGGGAASGDYIIDIGTPTGGVAAGKIKIGMVAGTAAATAAEIDIGANTKFGSGFSTTEVTGSGTPAVAVGVTAQLGTGPSAGISGSDLDGTVTVTTGTVPSAFAGNNAVIIATITFAATQPTSPPKIIVNAVNNSAVLLEMSTPALKCWARQADITTTLWKLECISPSTPTLAASTAYLFSYHVMN